MATSSKAAPGGQGRAGKGPSVSSERRAGPSVPGSHMPPTKPSSAVYVEWPWDCSRGRDLYMTPFRDPVSPCEFSFVLTP